MNPADLRPKPKQANNEADGAGATKTLKQEGKDKDLGLVNIMKSIKNLAISGTKKN